VITYYILELLLASNFTTPL